MSLLGEAPLGELPLGDFDDAYSESIADALTELLEKPWLDRSWWLRAKPRDASTSTDPPTTIDVDLSTDGHRTFPTDPEEFQLPKAIVEPYDVTVRLSGLWGVAEMDFGEITLGNPDGDLTHLTGEDWVGRQADVYVGPRGGVQVQFARVGRLLSRGIGWGRGTISIPVDDYSFLFDRQVQTNSYAGTGGLEGGDDIKGRPKPLLFGIERQIEPVPVDPANHVYQVHDGSFDALPLAEDGKSALSFDADVADITTATPSPGEYSTSLATGYIKLGEAPEKVLTVTAQGHDSSAYGYVEDFAGLVKLLTVVYAGLSDPGELDGVAFASVATHTAAMGHWTGMEPHTVRDVLALFCQYAGGWVWLRPDKLLTTGRTSDPASATADVELQIGDDVHFEPWQMDPYETPVGRVRVGYRRYSRTLSDTEVLGAVSEAVRKDAGEEYRYAKAEDDPTFVQTSEAQEITILTNLDQEADAQALADEQLALRKTQRLFGTIAPRAGLIKRGIGTVASITDDRLPASPKKFLVLGFVNRAAASGSGDRIEWEVFG